MADANDLKAGFTGAIDDEAAGLSSQAKSAATYVKREAGAVAANAQDHPSATGTALLVFGAFTFVAGYLIGSMAGESRNNRYW